MKITQPGARRRLLLVALASMSGGLPALGQHRPLRVVPPSPWSGEPADGGTADGTLPPAAPVVRGDVWVTAGNVSGQVLGGFVGGAGDIDDDGYSDVLIASTGWDNGQVDEGKVDLHLGSPSGPTAKVWSFESDTTGATIGIVGTAGDVNGDGFSDAFVASLVYGGGRVLVFHGSPSGFAATPDWTVIGATGSDWLGCAASSAGDVDGDGYSDLLVGAEGFDHGMTDTGRVELYRGSPTGLGATPAWSGYGSEAGARFGSAAAAAGDVNGDGFDDFLVGAPYADHNGSDDGEATLWLGNASGTPTFGGSAGGLGNSVQFGDQVGPAGDIDGDGHDDVFVYQQFEVHVFHGSPAGMASTPDRVLDENDFSGNLPGKVRTACGVGDLNGDGYDDLAVGGNEGFPGNDGTVGLFLGGAGGLAAEPARVLPSPQLGSFYGFKIAHAGDVDRDGLSDFIVPAYRYDQFTVQDTGAAYVYFGHGLAIHAPEGQLVADWSVTGQTGADLGRSTAVVGDVDGDGYEDVLVGAPGAGPQGRGEAYLYRGGEDGPEAEPTTTLVADAFLGADFGHRVADAGDVNGDGLGDVLVSDPYFGADGEGGVWLHMGTPAGLDATPAWSAVGEEPLARFGAGIAGVGDVNGDGFGDVAVGAPGEPLTSANRGAAYVFLGSRTGPSATPSWMAVGAPFEHLGRAVSGGELTGDGYDDVVVGVVPYSALGTPLEGHVRMHAGSESGPTGAPVWVLSDPDTGCASPAEGFGWSVDCRGDFDGDGRNDVAVGAPFWEECSTFLPDTGFGAVFKTLTVGAPVMLEGVYTFGDLPPNTGWGVDLSGDLDGDGRADLLVSAPGAAQSIGFLGRTDLLDAQDRIFHLEDIGLSCAGGDVNGDGIADLVAGRQDGTGAGELRVYLGNEGGGRVRRLGQARAGGASIAHLGRSDRNDAFRVRATFPRDGAPADWTTPVAPTVRLEWEVVPAGETFTGTASGQSAFAQPLVPGGEPPEFDELVTGLVHTTAYRWRARFVIEGNPFFQVTPWFHLRARGEQSWNLRTNVLGKPWKKK